GALSTQALAQPAPARAPVGAAGTFSSPATGGVPGSTMAKPAGSAGAPLPGGAGPAGVPAPAGAVHSAAGRLVAGPRAGRGRRRPRVAPEWGGGKDVARRPRPARGPDHARREARYLRAGVRGQPGRARLRAPALRHPRRRLGLAARPAAR